MPGNIIDNALKRPCPVKMGGVKPAAAPYEANLMAGLQIEEQSPAFLSHLYIFGQAEGHRLIYSANAVDAKLFDHDFLDNLGFFYGLALVIRNGGFFFIHNKFTSD
jgi:hypothetical protein